MKISLSIFPVLLLALAACTTIPEPMHDDYVSVSIAGQNWEKGRMARAVYLAEITAPERLPYFAEISLPNPDGSTPEIVREEIKKGATEIRATGSARSGWTEGTVYTFGLKIYADRACTQLLDTIDQSSLCHRPPNDLLDRLN